MTTVGIYSAVVSRSNQTNVTVMSSPDGAMGVTVDRVKILAGRLYDPKAPGQAMVDQQLASLEHLTPGGTLRLYGVPSAPSGAPEYNKAVTLTYRVTAIVVFDDEIVPTGTNNAGPTALVSWPFAAPPVAASLADGYEAAVRLTPGASLAAFSSAAENARQALPGHGGNIITINLSDQVNATERAIRPEAVALAVFAGLAGLIALAVIGQLLSRQLALDAAEFPILRALGVQRRGAGHPVAGPAGDRDRDRGHRRRGRRHRRVPADADRARPAGRAAPRRRGQPRDPRRRVRGHRAAPARRARPARLAGGPPGTGPARAWPSPPPGSRDRRGWRRR